ncbi:hypothetical protein CRG98_042697 [Punica granatum]|nr:hypothetical protein CRG98_042697 [Punica granatum]
MKQGINPATHQPLAEVQVKEENDESLLQPQEEVRTVSSLRAREPTFLVNDTLADHHNIGLVDSSRGMNGSALEYSLPFFECQAGLDPDLCNPSLMMSQYHSNSRSIFDNQNCIGTSPGIKFSSMPSLTNYENSTSKECSSNSSNISSYSSGIQVNDASENEAFDCLFQFAVKSKDDLNPSSWQLEEEHLVIDGSSVNFNSYQLTSLSEDFTRTGFGIFDQL